MGFISDSNEFIDEFIHFKLAKNQIISFAININCSFQTQQRPTFSTFLWKKYAVDQNFDRFQGSATHFNEC